MLHYPHIVKQENKEIIKEKKILQDLFTFHSCISVVKGQDPVILYPHPNI